MRCALTEDCFVEVAEGRIKSVRPMTNLGGTTAEIFDCMGKTVMPGLIQSHAHLARDGRA